MLIAIRRGALLAVPFAFLLVSIPLHARTRPSTARTRPGTIPVRRADFGEASRLHGQIDSDPAAVARLRGAYLRLPMAFEVNRGQIAPVVRFRARGPGHTLFLTSTEAVLALVPPVARRQEGTSSAAPPNTVVRLSAVGANPAPAATGEDVLPGTANYFRGNDPRQWRTGVQTYAKVRYRDLYPGIDLVYYGRHGHLETDFVVAPGADPDQIVLRLAGARRLKMDARGDVVLRTGGGALRLQRPLIYQDLDGGRHTVAGAWVHRGADEVGLGVAAYDVGRPLVIDPVLVYSTYLGGSDEEIGYDIAVDGAGNAYVAGDTRSADFPTTAGAPQTAYGGLGAGPDGDAFVTKINPSGTALVYSTYLGGSANDSARRMAVDGGGNAYVVGYTSSANFPTTAGAYQTTLAGTTNAFVTKVNPSGSGLVYSTLLGGSASDAFPFIAIALDGAGNAYLTGSTSSADFPTTPGVFQTTLKAGSNAFVAELNTSGAGLVYSTYLGGSGNPGDTGNAIAVDSLGNAYVTGATTSGDFPTTAGAFQTVFHGGGNTGCGGTINNAYVTKLNPSGTAPLLYSTFLGGTGLHCNGDYGRRIVIDATHDAYVIGNTSSDDFPTTTGAFQTSYGGGIYDAFVTEVNPSGTGLVFSTYLGGIGGEFGNGIALDAAGDVSVTGSGAGTDFPTTPGALPNGGDGFVTRLNPSGTGLVFSTLFGGSIFGFALDAGGTVYVTGMTGSPGFATTAGAFQTTFGGVADAFVAKIGVCGNGVLDAGEQCDDGGNVDGDGCDHACQLEPRTVSQTAAPGGTVTTDTGATGATPAQPIQAAVTTPSGGTVTISTGPSEPTPPPGFTVLTGLVQITAPAETAASPLVIVFELDAGIVPPGQDQNTIVIEKDGVAVPACTGGAGVASPDPCVSDRSTIAGGDVRITVLSSTASAWGLIADACGDAPRNDCRAPLKSSLLVRGDADGAAKASVKWTWSKGTAAKGDFGDPVNATDYTLCVYDQSGAGGSSRNRLRTIAPHGGTCAGKPCWADKKKGAKYADKALSADGLQQVILQAGEPGRAKIAVKGKGANLPVPSLPLTTPVRVQLRRSGSTVCWEATYAGTPIRNDQTQFKAKSQ